MKHIFTHDNIVVLHSVKNVLALNNIGSFIKNEHTVPIGAQHGINNIFHELWLMDARDFDQATALIQNIVENPDPASAWICKQCSEENDASFELCWKCHTAAVS